MKLKLTTNKILITGIILLLLSIATIIFFSIAKSRKVNDTAKLVAHTQEILFRSQKLLSLVVDYESGARSYILSGQKRFLEPLEKSKKEIYNQLFQLKALVIDNPFQEANIDSLSFYIDKRITFSNHTVVVRKLNGAEAAKAIVETGEGKIYTDQIRLITDKMQATENILLAQRKEANEKKAVELTRILMWVIIGVFILLGIIIQKVRTDFFVKRKTASSLVKLKDEVVKSNNTLSETFERITDAFIALDKNWRYTYMNKKAGEIFQRVPEQMIGKHIWNEFPESINQPFYKAYYQAMETQQYIYLEEYHAPYDLWFENHIYPSPDGLSIFFRNITQQKKAEEKLYKSEELLRLSSELANVAAWEYNVETESMSRSDNHDKLYGIENQGKWERNTFIDATHPDDRDTCNIIIDNSLAIGGPDQYKFDFRIIHPDKSIHWLNVIGKIIERNPEGLGKKIRGFITDITERKKALDEIKASEEKYRDLVDNINDIICTHDLDGRILFVNSAAEKLLGYKFNPQQNINIKDILSSDTRNQFSDYIANIKKEGHAQGLMKVQSNSGEIRIWEYNNSLITTGGDTSIVSGFTRDITERKKAEKEIKASEEKYRTLVEQASDSIFMSDENGKYVEVNESGCRLLGYTKEEIYHLHIKDLAVVDESFVPFRFDELKTGKTVIQQRKLKRKDGSVVRVEISAKQLPDGRMLGMIRNITERIEAQQMLQKEKELSEKIINSLPGLFYLSDSTPKLLKWNKIFETISGYTAEELRKIVPISLFDPVDHQTFKQSMADTYKMGYGNSEATLITKSGQKIPFYFTGVRIEYEGRPAMLGTGIDISDRKKAVAEIIASEENYRTLVEQASDAIFIADASGRFITVNTSACKLSQYSEKELLQMTIYDFAMMEDIQREPFHFEELKQGKTVYTERILKAKDGIPINVEITSKKLSDGRLLTFVRNISERKKAEEDIKNTYDQLQQLTAHLQSIREEERKRIGREIHDELGQQLTAIKMDVAWIDKKIPEEPTHVKNKLKNIVTLLDGSNQSIRRILNELRPAILDDHGLLEAIEWLGRQYTANTGIPVKFTTNKTEIKLSEPAATCIFRVCQEAFTNITRYAHAKKVATSINIIDDSIKVSIEDDGKGFDVASVQKKSFGILGMKERAISLKGKFELVTSQGKGTKIVINLPYKV